MKPSANPVYWHVGGSVVTYAEPGKGRVVDDLDAADLIGFYAAEAMSASDADARTHCFRLARQVCDALREAVRWRMAALA
jgi:hypothetical protein